jgi:hypothetical protein
MAHFAFWSQFKKFWWREALAPEASTARAQGLEIGIISLGAVALAWWFTPADPTLAKQEFPWLWFAPMLVALRYGVLPSLLSTSVVLGNVWLAWLLGRLPDGMQEASLFGGGIAVLVCGEFSDVWRVRNQRMEEAYIYMSDRLSRLTKRHLLLNLSHDKLEQEMLSRPGSLRDALARLRTLSLQADPADPMPGANGLLQLLSQYVNIESAQIYLLERNGVSQVLGRSVARLGEPSPLPADDELLNLVLERGGMAHIASPDVSLQRHSSQLVVAPLVAGDEDMVAVLAVTRMPFFALTNENLQLMLVMLGYFADNLRASAGVHAIQMQVPNVPFLFAQELARLVRLHQKLTLPSHMVVMRFDGARQHEIPAEFLRIKRGLDIYWQTLLNNVPALVVLMPFATTAVKNGFLHRMEDWLRSRFQGDFESLQIDVHVIDFDVSDPLLELTKVVTSS